MISTGDSSNKGSTDSAFTTQTNSLDSKAFSSGKRNSVGIGAGLGVLGVLVVALVVGGAYIHHKASSAAPLTGDVLTLQLKLLMNHNMVNGHIWWFNYSFG